MIMRRASSPKLAPKTAQLYPEAMPKRAINKAQWIRDNDANTPSAELIAKAKKEGVTITAAQIYTTRAESKKKAGTSPKTSPKASTPAKGGSFEELLRGLVREEIRRYFTER